MSNTQKNIINFLISSLPTSLFFFIFYLYVCTQFLIPFQFALNTRCIQDLLKFALQLGDNACCAVLQGHY